MMANSARDFEMCLESYYCCFLLENAPIDFKSFRTMLRIRFLAAGSSSVSP